MFGINSFGAIYNNYIYISRCFVKDLATDMLPCKRCICMLSIKCLSKSECFRGPNISKISSAFSGVMVFFPTSSKVSAVVPCCCRYASVVFSNDRDAGRGAGRTGRGCRWHRGAGRGASARGALWLRLAAESSTLKVRSEGLLV